MESELGTRGGLRIAFEGRLQEVDVADPGISTGVLEGEDTRPFTRPALRARARAGPCPC